MGSKLYDLHPLIKNDWLRVVTKMQMVQEIYTYNPPHPYIMRMMMMMMIIVVVRLYNEDDISMEMVCKLWVIMTHDVCMTGKNV